MLHLRAVILALLRIELALQAGVGGCCTADLQDGRRSLQQDAAVHRHGICRHREQQVRQQTAARPAAQYQPESSVTEQVFRSSGSTPAARYQHSSDTMLSGVSLGRPGLRSAGSRRDIAQGLKSCGVVCCA